MDKNRGGNFYWEDVGLIRSEGLYMLNLISAATFSILVLINSNIHDITVFFHISTL